MIFFFRFILKNFLLRKINFYFFLFTLLFDKNKYRIDAIKRNEVICLRRLFDKSRKISS
jgi:hypothetical protein